MSAWLQWVARNGTAETPLLFSVFHLLMAGLTLVVLLYQLRSSRTDARGCDRLCALAFAAFSAGFVLQTVCYGAQFFLQPAGGVARLGSPAHAAFTCAMVFLCATFRERPLRSILPACVVIIGITAVDLSFSSDAAVHRHSALMLVNDTVALIAAMWATKATLTSGSRLARSYRFAMLVTTAAFVCHTASAFLRNDAKVLAWNGEQTLISVSLFAFAWLAGERSVQLLDRIFVRLNLTFIVLATIIMLTTLEMQRYQYLRQAEQRSMELGDFLRDQVLHYEAEGEGLAQITRHTSIADRIAAESVNLPELRHVYINLDGQSAAFIGSERRWQFGSAKLAADSGGFRLLHLPLDAVVPGRSGGIELVGSLDYINRYTGHYVLLVYGVFTVVVLLSTCIIGIVAAETDRHLQRKYAELQQTHEKLAQAAKLASVGELAGGMAHQINTPVTSILSLATHLSEEKSTTALTTRQRKSLQIIAEQAQRVSIIVTGLLNFSRQSRLHFTAVDLPDVVNTALALVQYRLDANTIRIERCLEPDLPLVHADRGAVTEVLVNLLNNAIDAMPGGVLTIVAQRGEDDTVRVEVCDTGIGIRAEELSRIFDPFYTTKEPGRGTGLGLSISHGIIKEHGSDIWAYSAPGEGTTVAFTLPREMSVEETHSGRR